MSSYKGLTAILKKYTERLFKKFADLIEPVSSMKMYAGPVQFGINEPKWHLFCLGQIVLIEDYPTLYTKLGGERSPWNTGTIPAGCFRIPDMRECVPVGAGLQNTNPSGDYYYKNKTRVYDSTELDPSTGTQGTQDHDPYMLGEFHDDQFQDHWHQQWTNDVYANTKRDNYYPNSGSAANKDYYEWKALGGRRGTTTHGKQVGLYYIIKY